jgi:outer membrane lipoprotein carrier protein
MLQQISRVVARRVPVLRPAAAGLVFLLAVGGAAAAAGGSDTALDRYLNGMTSLRTDFTQTVTDARGTQTESGAGTLLVARPGRFRWDYQPRAEAAAATAAGTSGNIGQRGQLLVADGKNLWFYDRELAQVSVKPVAAALSATPVMLLSGSATQLHESFDISAAASHDGLDWVSVKPRSAEADFSHAELGFARERLARMVVTDRLGQTVRLDFSHSQRNARIEPSDLQFKPPADVDVIGTPQS